MSSLQPPKASPELPDAGPDVPTDPGLHQVLLRHEVKQRQLQMLELQNANAELSKNLSIRNLIWAGGIIVAVFVAGITFYGQAMAQVEKKTRETTDAGLLEMRIEIKYVKKEQARQGDQIDRVAKVVDLLADKMRIAESARPPPVPDAPKPDAGVKRPK